jgi:hypothetical protein
VTKAVPGRDLGLQTHGSECDEHPEGIYWRVEDLGE